MNFNTFMAFSALVSISSETLKNLIHIYQPNFKCGMLLAFIFGVGVSATYGTGLLGGGFGIAYDTALFPLAFRTCDIIMSGIIYMLSSKAISDIAGVYKSKKETSK